MIDCCCGSGRRFEDCCRPLLDRTARPRTAEELMRSRYAAYAVADVEYLLRTTHPSTRDLYNAAGIGEWACANRWQKLEILSTTGGGAADKKGTVEFRAHYLDAAGESRIHHEISNFAKELGRWFFVDGKIVDARF